MVKECLVTLNNSLVTVVLFDDKYIQFPAIHKDIKKVNVRFENGKYSIIENNAVIEESASKDKKKNRYKKTTVEFEQNSEVQADDKFLE